MRKGPFILGREPVDELRGEPQRIALRLVLVFCGLAFGLGILLGVMMK